MIVLFPYRKKIIAITLHFFGINNNYTLFLSLALSSSSGLSGIKNSSLYSPFYLLPLHPAGSYRLLVLSDLIHAGSFKKVSSSLVSWSRSTSSSFRFAASSSGFDILPRERKKGTISASLLTHP